MISLHSGWKNPEEDKLEQQDLSCSALPVTSLLVAEQFNVLRSTYLSRTLSEALL